MFSTLGLRKDPSGYIVWWALFMVACGEATEVEIGARHPLNGQTVFRVEHDDRARAALTN